MSGNRPIFTFCPTFCPINGRFKDRQLRCVRLPTAFLVASFGRTGHQSTTRPREKFLRVDLHDRIVPLNAILSGHLKPSHSLWNRATLDTNHTLHSGTCESGFAGKCRRTDFWPCLMYVFVRVTQVSRRFGRLEALFPSKTASQERMVRDYILYRLLEAEHVAPSASADLHWSSAYHLVKHLAGPLRRNW